MDLPPHVDTDRLQINVTRLNALHKVGAMTAGYVVSYEGDVTETTPNIVGVNADGSAMAGKSGTTNKADKSQTAYTDIEPIGLIGDAPMIMSMFSRPVMVHRINRPEAASDVVDIVRDGKTSDEAWGGGTRQSIAPVNP
jgi:hypothetical protein